MTKRRLEINLEPPPLDPPDQYCRVCQQMRPGWEFNGQFGLGVCFFCFMPRGMRPFPPWGKDAPSYDWHDRTIISIAASIIYKLEKPLVRL